jgi:hypothetical protein
VKQYDDRPFDCVIHGEIPNIPDSRFVVVTNTINDETVMKIIREDKKNVVGRSKAGLTFKFGIGTRDQPVGRRVCEYWADRLDKATHNQSEARALLRLNRQETRRRIQGTPEVQTDVDECTLYEFSLGYSGKVWQTPHQLTINCSTTLFNIELTLRGNRSICMTSIDAYYAAIMCGPMLYVRSIILE